MVQLPDEGECLTSIRLCCVWEIKCDHIVPLRFLSLSPYLLLLSNRNLLLHMYTYYLWNKCPSTEIFRSSLNLPDCKTRWPSDALHYHSVSHLSPGFTFHQQWPVCSPTTTWPLILSSLKCPCPKLLDYFFLTVLKIHEIFLDIPTKIFYILPGF